MSEIHGLHAEAGAFYDHIGRIENDFRKLRTQGDQFYRHFPFATLRKFIDSDVQLVVKDIVRSFTGKMPWRFFSPRGGKKRLEQYEPHDDFHVILTPLTFVEFSFKERCESFCLIDFTASWPHAASMLSPVLLRTKTVTCDSLSLLTNSSNFAIGVGFSVAA
jgi:hypothetical protein